MFNQVVGIDIRLLPLKIMFRITKFILIQLYADDQSLEASQMNIPQVPCHDCVETGQK